MRLYAILSGLKVPIYFFKKRTLYFEITKDSQEITKKCIGRFCDP